MGLEAREEINVVSSSSLAPFVQFVAEEMNKEKKFPTPKIEIKTSEKSFKDFCSGGGLDTPDLVHSNRRINRKEFNKCVKNGVKDMSEAIIGYDAIVLAQNISSKTFNISNKELMLALLAKVPSKDGFSLIDNPYKKWSDINPNLPRKNILIYTLKNDASSLITIQNMIIKPIIDKMIVYNDKENPYEIREDMAHLKISNKQRLIQSLRENKIALGVMNFTLSNQYKSKIEPILIEKVSPSIDTIATTEYPLSNRLYFYSKNGHKRKITSMQPYLETFMNKKMIGKEGALSKLGLIPLNKNEMYTKIKYMIEGKKLLVDDLNSDFFHLAL